MELGTGFRIDESTSSWTLRIDVAENFKGGVAPEGMDLLPVIFRVLPDASSVILNIGSLYSDRDFLDSVEKHQCEIIGFCDGIGRWRDSQAEVVLDLEMVYLHEVYATGGHSSAKDQILDKPEIREELMRLGPNAIEIVKKAIASDEGKFGPRWLTGTRKDQILRKWVEKAAILRTKCSTSGTCG